MEIPVTNQRIEHLERRIRSLTFLCGLLAFQILDKDGKPREELIKTSDQ